MRRWDGFWRGVGKLGIVVKGRGGMSWDGECGAKRGLGL